MKGYHQRPLDNESQMLTTFITLFGRFKFLRASYEISSISEHYNCRMDEAFAGLSGFCGIVDDVVIYATHHADGCVQFYTINDIIPLIMGRKECTPTLFPASVMEAGWEKNSVRVHQSSCLLYIGKKECRGTLFPACVI